PTGEQANRRPHHPPAPSLRAKPLEQIAPRSDGRVDEVDNRWGFREMVRAPGDSGRGSRHITDRKGQARSAQPEVPVAEQAAPEEPRHLHVGPIDQRRGTNDAYLDLSARGRFGHKSLGFTLAPRVRAESLRLFR